MKKIALLALSLVAFMALAATCVVKNVELTEIDGDDHFAGEMENGTVVDILGHRYVVAFLDDNGNVLETRTVDGCLRSLQSGEVDYFSAQSTEDPDDVEVGLARLALDGTLKLGQTANGDLFISNISVTRDGENLVVSGRIRNDDSDDLEDVRVCAVIRNEDGRVIRIARDNDTYDLDEDQQTTFAISVTVPDDADDVDTVDVVADAINPSEDDAPTDPVEETDNDVEECDDPTATPTGTQNTSTPTNTPTSTTTPPANTATPTQTLDDAC